MILLVRTDRTQAYLLKDVLASHGIKAHVFNAHLSSIVGDVPPDVAQPQVWLERDDDRERAATVLTAIERDGASSEERVCPACGEASPQAFDLCWKCGAALPA